MFCISFLGAFIFWSYTGILTSFSAVHSFSIPVKSLDDLQKITNFQFYIYGGGSEETLLQKWAQSPEKSAIWRQKAYEKFIKTGTGVIFNQMLNSDVSSNTAFLLDESVVGKIFEQSNSSNVEDPSLGTFDSNCFNHISR